MLIEQLIFAVIAIALFVIIFIKMLKNNDTSYIVVLILSVIGLLIDLIEVIASNRLPIVLKIIKYIVSIINPIVIIVMEKRKIKFLEARNVLKAKFFLKYGNTKSAKEALITIANKYPQSYIAHKMLAEVYELEGGMRKAIDEYVQAIDINKKDYDSYYTIANLLTQLDKKDEATQMLNSLLQKKPDYYKATELLGELLIEKEMYKEAVNIYTEGLKYNPTSFELNYNLGIAFTMLNDFQSAKIYYEKAAEFNSLAYNTKYSLAEIAMIYKELEEAERYFLEVLEEENSELEADAYFELAKICIIKGEKQKAIEYANIAIEVDTKKIVPKIKNDEIFIPIIAKINIPFNLENLTDDEKEVKLTKNELIAKEHLEEMVDITRTLGYNDIDLLKRNSRKKENDFNLIDFEKKERE
ncbi:MAG: tetratricopeptide repeat protein [Clostridia bacterium]|nr:tetratricopeptide repeat protein [Clostridia bacterium]